MKVWMRPRARRLDRLAAAVDILLGGAGEAAHHRVARALGDLVDGVEVAFRCNREARLDDVDAHRVEHLGDLELLLVRHGGAGRLLAVPQGGVEYDDAVLVGLGLRGHENFPSANLSRRSGALRVLSAFSPECPGANAQAALRGG